MSTQQAPFTGSPYRAQEDQRWRDGTPRWRTPAQGYFDPKGWDLTPLDETPARAFVEQHHYSRSWVAAKFRFGIINKDTGDLGGVIVYGIPASEKALTKPFPTLTPYVESVELSRLVLLDDLAFNAESWAVARAHRILRDHGVKGVLSFSDPMPRHAEDGTVLSPGHRGTTYRALNAIEAGRGTARTLTILPNGQVLNDRSVQKLRGGERGGEAVYRRLRDLGAPDLGSRSVTEWLPDALYAVKAKRVRHPGNYRFLWRLGSAREQARIPLGSL